MASSFFLRRLTRPCRYSSEARGLSCATVLLRSSGMLYGYTHTILTPTFVAYMAGAANAGAAGVPEDDCKAFFFFEDCMFCLRAAEGSIFLIGCVAVAEV